MKDIYENYYNFGLRCGPTFPKNEQVCPKSVHICFIITYLPDFFVCGCVMMTYEAAIVNLFKNKRRLLLRRGEQDRLESLNGKLPLQSTCNTTQISLSSQTWVKAVTRI